MAIANCLIVDDEPIAREIILGYCSHLPMLHVIASCGNAFEAKEILQGQQVDILFLDINMPVLDGIAFLKTLKKMPEVIFTTAHKDYAVSAFDLSACDYLLKPFSIERFMIAVDRALQKLNQFVKDQPQRNLSDLIFIKAGNKIYNVHANDILYAEAKGNYTKIVSVNITILPAMSFSSFEKILPGDLFIRVHRSYIINKSRIKQVEGNTLYIGSTEIPIGSFYRDFFFRSIGI